MKIEFDSGKQISILDEAIDRRGPTKKLKGNKRDSESLERRNKRCC